MTGNQAPRSDGERVFILGVPVDNLDLRILHERMAGMIRDKAHGLVLNVNVHCLNLAARLPWLKELLNKATIVFCDGSGVILGARILGKRIRQRITYADWIWELADLAEREQWTLYFLGAKPGVAEKAALRLRSRYPGIRIVGTRHGYFDKTPASRENESVVQDINRTAPNVLLVAFGMPLQEHWLMENWDHINADIALAGGAALDYASGSLRRAPRWMTDSGLEWLGRLLIEPSRLWKRYLLGNPAFLWRVLLQRWRS